MSINQPGWYRRKQITFAAIPTMRQTKITFPRISKGTPGGQKGSPYRKEMPVAGQPKKNKETQHIVDVIGFPPTPLELYSYKRGNAMNGYSEGYTYPIRQFVDGTHDIPLLQDTGLVAYYPLRKESDDNALLRGADNWPRYAFVRINPGNEPSSVDT